MFACQVWLTNDSINFPTFQLPPLASACGRPCTESFTFTVTPRPRETFRLLVPGGVSSMEVCCCAECVHRCVKYFFHDWWRPEVPVHTLTIPKSSPSANAKLYIIRHCRDTVGNIVTTMEHWPVRLYKPDFAVFTSKMTGLICLRCRKRKRQASTMITGCESWSPLTHACLIYIR